MKHTVEQINALLKEFQKLCKDYESHIGKSIKTLDQDGVNIITKRIPELLYVLFDKELYNVKGSVGQGCVAKCPWVVVRHKAASPNTREGVYIVFLFSRDLKEIYLTLNQGVTDVDKHVLLSNQSSIRNALNKESVLLKHDNDFNVDNEGYMQLTSNLAAAYEAALGDIFDVVLTGIIDRNIETVGEGDSAKRYATDAIRKLYFRGTPEIDAGGRFAADAVPEFMVFDKPNMAADFIKIVEEGMEKSKTNFAAPKKAKKSTPAPVVVEPEDIEDEEDTTPPFDVDDIDDLDAPVEVDFAALRTEIRNKNKAGTPEQKKAVKAILTATGKKLDELEDMEAFTQMLEVFN